MKKKILIFLLLIITALMVIGGMNQTQAAICAYCKAGNHRSCPLRTYKAVGGPGGSYHSVACCCGGSASYLDNCTRWQYQNNSEYCYRCLCGRLFKHNSNGGYCSKVHCPYAVKRLCTNGCNHRNWVNCKGHSYSSSWSRNTEQHWHKCVVTSSCSAKSALGNHVDENSDGKCDVCEVAGPAPGGGASDEVNDIPGNPIITVENKNFNGSGDTNILNSNTSVSLKI